MNFQDIKLITKKIIVGILVFLVPLLIFLAGLFLVQNSLP
jgi:hypothetical protein